MGTATPKPKRFTSKNYLNYIRAEKCLVCGYPQVDPHHMKSRGAGGSDLTCVPLCRMHHIEIEAGGVRRFDRKYDISVAEEQFRLLQSYIEAGRKL